MLLDESRTRMMSARELAGQGVGLAGVPVGAEDGRQCTRFNTVTAFLVGC